MTKLDDALQSAAEAIDGSAFPIFSQSLMKELTTRVNAIMSDTNVNVEADNERLLWYVQQAKTAFSTSGVEAGEMIRALHLLVSPNFDANKLVDLEMRDLAVRSKLDGSNEGILARTLLVQAQCADSDFSRLRFALCALVTWSSTWIPEHATTPQTSEIWPSEAWCRRVLDAESVQCVAECLSELETCLYEAGFGFDLWRRIRSLWTRRVLCRDVNTHEIAALSLIIPILVFVSSIMTSRFCLSSNVTNAFDTQRLQANMLFIELQRCCGSGRMANLRRAALALLCLHGHTHNTSKLHHTNCGEFEKRFELLWCNHLSCVNDVIRLAKLVLLQNHSHFQGHVFMLQLRVDSVDDLHSLLTLILDIELTLPQQWAFFVHTQNSIATHATKTISPRVSTYNLRVHWMRLFPVFNTHTHYSKQRNSILSSLSHIPASIDIALRSACELSMAFLLSLDNALSFPAIAAALLRVENDDDDDDGGGCGGVNGRSAISLAQIALTTCCGRLAIIRNALINIWSTTHKHIDASMARTSAELASIIGSGDVRPSCIAELADYLAHCIARIDSHSKHCRWQKLLRIVSSTERQSEEYKSLLWKPLSLLMVVVVEGVIRRSVFNSYWHLVSERWRRAFLIANQQEHILPLIKLLQSALNCPNRSLSVCLSNRSVSSQQETMFSAITLILSVLVDSNIRDEHNSVALIKVIMQGFWAYALQHTELQIAVLMSVCHHVGIDSIEWSNSNSTHECVNDAVKVLREHCNRVSVEPISTSVLSVNHINRLQNLDSISCDFIVSHIDTFVMFLRPESFRHSFTMTSYKIDAKQTDFGAFLKHILQCLSECIDFNGSIDNDENNEVDVWTRHRPVWIDALKNSTTVCDFASLLRSLEAFAMHRAERHHTFMPLWQSAFREAWLYSLGMCRIAHLQSLSNEIHMAYTSYIEHTKLENKEDQISNKVDQISNKEDQISNKVDQISNKEDQISNKIDQISNKEDQISNKIDQISNKIDANDTVFGRLLPEGVSYLLDREHLCASKGNVLVDLGMGVGKLAMQAFLCYPNLSLIIGVDTSPTHFHTAVQAMHALQRAFPARFTIASTSDVECVLQENDEDKQYTHVVPHIIEHLLQRVHASINAQRSEERSEKLCVRKLIFRRQNLFECNEKNTADVVVLSTRFRNANTVAQAHLRELFARLKPLTRVATLNDLPSSLYGKMQISSLQRLSTNERRADTFATSWSPNGHRFHCFTRRTRQ